MRQPARERCHDTCNVENPHVHGAGQSAPLDEALDHCHDSANCCGSLDMWFVSIHETLSRGGDPMHGIVERHRIGNLDQRLIRGQEPVGDLEDVMDGVGSCGAGQRRACPTGDREPFQLAEDGEHGIGERTVWTRHARPIAAESSATASTIAMHLIVDSADFGQAISADARHGASPAASYQA